MQSFYGGRRGISFILKKSFSSIAEMNEFFAKGAETTSEVGYGEYVVVNTQYTRDKSNGQVYMRGFDGAEGPICSILGPRGNSPAIRVTTDGEVKDYINTYDSINSKYTETWITGEGSWGAQDDGVTLTVYQLIADPTVVITASEYNELTEYGKQAYKEVRTLNYIKIVYYYISLIDNTNLITKDYYDSLPDEQKINFSKCYTKKTDNDVKISEVTYNTLINKNLYELYKTSDKTNMILETEYELLSNDDKVYYQECYTDRVTNQIFLSEDEYKKLASEEKLSYTPYFYIRYYLYSDISQQHPIDIYTYDNLTDLGQKDYQPITISKNQGLRAPDKNADSYIYYSYANVLDDYGNITSCYIGFSFPYYQDKFFTTAIEPYNENGEILKDTDVVEAKIHNNKDFNYYKEWTLAIPKGVQGDSISNVFIAPDYAPAGSPIANQPGNFSTKDAYFTSFTFDSNGKVKYGCRKIDDDYYEFNLSEINTKHQVYYYWMELTDYSKYKKGTKKYEKIAPYQAIRRVEIATSNGDDYKVYDLLILYNEGSQLGTITYDGITGWVNAGNTRGKIQGLRIFAVYNNFDDFKDAILTDDADVQKTPEQVAEEAGIADYSNVAGWGVIVYDETAELGALYYYNYLRQNWVKCSNNVGAAGMGGGVSDPSSILFLGDEDSREDADAALVEDGFWFMTETINRAY